MCGRYALALRPPDVRRQLRDSGMPTQDDDDAPGDEEYRQTYNFAPGYYGLVYRSDAPDGNVSASQRHPTASQSEQEAQDVPKDTASSPQETQPTSSLAPSKPHYKLQQMKWGLIPFWTKRNPDYTSTMRTINCRDDSLSTSGGMWQTMKQNKRCIVLAQGFYEWLKKPNSKAKIPHYVKRKDGQLMCFAGLFDSVKFEDAADAERMYTYTIITTDSNPQLNFLHDRMPVILENGSAELFTWVDNEGHASWSPELQALLKPYKGELECYPVVKDVGKVGNNSPTFIVPVDSKDNKNNIANFFGNAKTVKEEVGKEEAKEEVVGDEGEAEAEAEAEPHSTPEMNHEPRDTLLHSSVNSESNAPVPVPAPPTSQGTKRSHDEQANSPDTTSPAKKTNLTKRSRNATSNHTLERAAAKKPSPVKASDGSKKITSFFAGGGGAAKG